MICFIRSKTQALFSMMAANMFLAFKILLISLSFSSQQLDHVPVISWHDLIANDTISEYLEYHPFVIRDSPMRSWPLTQYLQHHTIQEGNDRLISYFNTADSTDETDRRFSFLKAEFRETTCCFTESPSLCKQYVSSFLHLKYIP